MAPTNHNSQDNSPETQSGQNNNQNQFHEIKESINKNESLSQSLLNNSEDLNLIQNIKQIDIKNDNWIKLCPNIVVKYIFLVFSALLTTGVFFQGAILSLLRKEIKKQFGLSDSDFTLLFQVPSFVNLLFPYLTGVLNDKFGPDKMLLFYTIQTILSMVAFQISQEYNNYALLMIYSILSYLSQEAITVAQNTITSQWFYGDNIAFALGVLVLNIRVTEIISTNSVPILYESEKSLADPIWLGIVLCGLSFFSSLVIFFMNKTRVKKLNDKQIQSIPNRKSRKIKFTDIKYLKSNFWIVSSLCSLGYASFYLFMQKFEEIATEKLKVGNIEAGNLQSIMYFISMAGPFLGILIDRIGKRVIFLIIAFVIQCGVYILWLVLPECTSNCYGIGLIPVILQGTFLCIFSSVIWSCFPTIVQPRFLSTAFGLTSSMKAISFSIFPYFLSYISTEFSTIDICYPLLGITVVGLLLCVILYGIDKRHGNLLNDFNRSFKCQNILMEQQERDEKKENDFNENVDNNGSQFQEQEEELIQKVFPVEQDQISQFNQQDSIQKEQNNFIS